MNSKRVAILGPCHTAPFLEHLSLNRNSTPVPPGMGGYNITHLVLARLARGISTDVITCDPSISKPLRFNGPLLRLWVVPRRRQHLMRDLYRRESKLICSAIAESAPECVHANWANEYALAAAHSGLPWVLSMHDNPFALIRWIGVSHVLSFLLSLWIMRKATQVTGVSPYVCEYVRQFGGRRAECIPNILHLPLLRSASHTPPNLPASGALVVAALNWSRFKNTKRALKAFCKLRTDKPSAVFCVMGFGLQDSGPAEAWARKHGLKHGVTFLGSQPYANCANAIEQADVLFHPALEEAMGCPVAEAMALGTAVVCCQQAKGPAWLTAEGQFGVLLDGTSTAAMAAGLATALDKSETRRRADITSARDHILSVVDPDTALARYEALYAQSIVTPS